VELGKVRSFCKYYSGGEVKISLPSKHKSKNRGRSRDGRKRPSREVEGGFLGEKGMGHDPEEGGWSTLLREKKAALMERQN